MSQKAPRKLVKYFFRENTTLRRWGKLIVYLLHLILTYVQRKVGPPVPLGCNGKGVGARGLLPSTLLYATDWTVV